MMAKLLSRVMSAVMVILLANHLLPASFGIYVLAMAMAYLASVSMDFGFDEMAVREVSRRPEQTAGMISTILFSRLLLSILNFSALALAYLLFVPWMETTLSLAVLFIAGVMLSMERLIGTFESIFQAHQRMDVQGMTELLGRGTYLVMGYWGILMGYDLERILLLMLVSYAVHFGISLVAYILTIGAGFVKPDLSRIPPILKKTLPFTYFVLLAVFYGHIIVILLTLMEGDHATGVYSAGWKIIVFMGVVPYSFGRALYPVFSRMYQRGAEELGRAYDRSMKYMLMAGMPVTVLLYLMSEDMLSLIYRAEFADTVPIFRTLVWMVPFLFMNGSLKIVLWSSDRTKEASLNLLISVIALVFFSLLFIPIYGVAGAATAVVGAEMVHFLLNYHRVSGFLDPLPLAHLWKPFVATLAMGAVFALLVSRELGMIPLLGTALLTYPVALYLLKGLDRRDLEMFTEMVKR